MKAILAAIAAWFRRDDDTTREQDDAAEINPYAG
jgi:hypothetical protein